MKKLILSFTMAMMFIALSAQSITLDINKAKTDSVLHDYMYDKTLDWTFSKPISINENNTDIQQFMVDVNKFQPSKSDYDLLLQNGIEIEDVKVVIKFPVVALAMNVSDGLNFNTALTGSELKKTTYGYWFDRNGIYVYNNFAYAVSIDWRGHILTGSEVKKVYDVSATTRIISIHSDEFKTAKENGIKAF